jgi:hypothetical protein
MPADTGFHNQNLIRAFPFIANVETNIPDWLIVDFRAVILDGAFDPRIHSIELAWVARFENKLRFGFRTDAPELADQELVFSRELDGGDYVTEFVDSVPLLETPEDRCGCSVELLCNPDQEGTPSSCGPELLCNPNHDASCSIELLCNPKFNQ